METHGYGAPYKIRCRCGEVLEVDLKGKMCSKQSFYEGENKVEGGGASEGFFSSYVSKLSMTLKGKHRGEKVALRGSK